MDQAWAVAVDSAGDAYVTGETISPDFPTTPGAFDPSANASRDAFVTRLNTTGTGLVYSTYLGGSGPDGGLAIAVDSAGNAFVAGHTASPDFPTTPGAFDRTCGTDGDCDHVGVPDVYDAFVVKLNASGRVLDYSTFLGGSQNDGAASVAIDPGGAAHVTGATDSWDFPTTAGAVDRVCGTDGNCNFDGLRYQSDAFVTKLSPLGTFPSYSTFLGGSRSDAGLSVAVDALGNSYLTGDAQSDDFPTTPGAFQRVRGADTDGDAFVAKVNPAGSALVYSTFLGGSRGDETGEAIAVDAAGNAFVSGDTYSFDFPTTPGAFDGSFNSPPAQYDQFLAKLNATGGGLLYSTFLGGSAQDGSTSGTLAVAATGEAYATGFTNSFDFPTTPGAYQRLKGRGYDAFLAKLDANGSALAYSTFFGGQGDDLGRAVAVDAAGDAYVVGWTGSMDFPTTVGAFERNLQGGMDTFVLKFALLPDLRVSGVVADPVSPDAGSSSTITVNVTNAGDVDAPPSSVLAFEDRNGNDKYDLGEDLGAQALPGLAVFASEALGFPWIPDVPGLHRVCALADPAGAVREGNETNNLLCTDVLAVEPAVGSDYVPQDPQPASPVTVGLFLDVSLSVRVTNEGNGSANGTATLAFFNASTPGTPFATFSVPPLAAGEVSAPFVAVWRSPAVAGTHAILADVDYANDLAEWNEMNNTYTWTVAVVPGPITTLVVGQPNVTVAETFVTSATPLSFSVLDQSGTGIRSTRYQVAVAGWTDYAAPFTLGGEGPHLVEWFSEDNAENVEAVRAATVYVDDTPPATTLAVGDPKVVGADTYVTSATPFVFLAVDGGVTPVGLAATAYRIDGAPTWTPYVAPFSLVVEGSRVVEYRSVDLLGNTEGPHAATIVVDDTPPTVTIDVGTPRYGGAATYVTSATPLTITAADGGAVPVGLASVEYRLGGPWIPYAAPFALAGPDGPKTVEYRATDFLGNAASGQLDVVLDDTPPVTTPSRGDGAHPAGTAFAFSATDAGSGLARTEVRVDGGAWTAYATPLVLAEGAHTVRFRSVDRLGNTEPERTLSVTIGGAPVWGLPPVADLVATPPSAEVGTPIAFDGSASTDPDGTIVDFAFAFGDGTAANGTVAARDHAYAAPGVYAVTLTVTDDDGNTSTARATVAITTTSAPPREANWKPLVAAVFASVLALVGAWSARHAPWPRGSRPRLRAFAFIALPFVAVEMATGVLSLLTGLLAIPPLLGAGTAVDVAILVVGAALALYGVRPRTPREAISKQGQL
jgi:hypothetical protein